MAPYFETVKSFADVSITQDGIETQDFLHASDGLVQLFDLLGHGVFTFVQADIRSNISGVRVRFEGHRDISTTLEHLVKSEYEEEQHSNRHATACLVRLIRGLKFVHKALQITQDDRSRELHSCFRLSYDEVLRHHHSFVVRSLVGVAIRAVPRREDFYMRIAQGGSIAKLDQELSRWLVGLEKIVRHMTDFLHSGNYGRI